jgi:hypothetical protein
MKIGIPDLGDPYCNEEDLFVWKFRTVKIICR